MIDETTKSWYYEEHYWEAQESGRGRDPTGELASRLDYSHWGQHTVVDLGILDFAGQRSSTSVEFYATW